ncbi:MAG: hypothetical protein JW715_02755 [Sedimentisphaerales bacterium]|nr:hypothetical protein [Sedimentisphaerales bacterium]
MKKQILARYELTEQNEVVIDVSIRTVEDLYNNFDRTAPYMKKDLDQEFVDYIIDSVREVGNNSFIIRITLSNMPDEITMSRVRSSIYTFFQYLKDIERRALETMFRRSFMLFGIGLALLALAIAATRKFSSSEGVLAEVFAQGLTIAAWVSLWEAIANLFVEWRPHTKSIRLYEQVMNSPVMFRHLPVNQSAAGHNVVPES